MMVFLESTLWINFILIVLTSLVGYIAYMISRYVKIVGYKKDIEVTSIEYKKHK